MRFLSISGGFALAILALPFLPYAASAETLDLTCTSADSSHSWHLTVDLTSGLVSNDAGGSGRRWAARVTGNDISWDEAFDSRIGHTANHYAFDRATGSLRRTDMTRSESGREAVNAICQKAS